MGVHLLEKTMETRSEKVHANGSTWNGNGYSGPRHNSYHPGPKASLAWLDSRVFYIRFSKCDINDESTPEYLTLNHVPLNRDTLLEVNGVRSSIYSDGTSTLLRRDRLDKKSEEVTFVSTDSLRTTGSLKFEVFDKDVLLVSGVLDLCHINGVHGKSNDYISRWRIECDTDMVAGNGFLKGKQNTGNELDPPSIEVCLAGSFAGNPIILTETLQLSHRKKQARKGLLEAIPENEEDDSCGLTLKVAEYPSYKPEHEYRSLYSGIEYVEGEDGELSWFNASGIEYVEGEDGELSWFNAGVRVGVGIGMSVCLGIGIGVGLLVRTYQGTTGNFRRRVL